MVASALNVPYNKYKWTLFCCQVKILYSREKSIQVEDGEKEERNSN